MRAIHLAILAVLPFCVPALLSAQSGSLGGSQGGSGIDAQPKRLDDPWRPPVNFVDENPAPPIPADVTDDRRVVRNYPEQPPVIPHNVRDYQISLNNNQCLTCHSRRFTEGSQAPMISITHYVDREGQTLGGVSPRRYFCMQCHVPQTVAQPIVPNTFKDIDSLLNRPSEGGGHQ